MRQNALFLLIFFSFSYISNAQTKKFATSTPVVATVSGVDISTNASDENLATKARITSSLLNNSRYIELRFPATVPANTPAYVKVAMQDNKFAALIGGALGDLLTNLLSGIVGNQQVRVQAKKGPNATTDVVLDSQTEGFAGDKLKVAMDGSGNYYIVITPSQNYNRIRITNTIPALSADKWLDVYDAFYIESTASCGIGTYTSFSGTGLVSLVDTGVTNAHYAIDSDMTNYSSLSLGLLGVGTSVEQSVYFEGPSQSTDMYTVKLRLTPSLLTAGLLNNVQLVAHKNGSVVSTKEVSALLTADLLGLINQGHPVSIPFYPGEADRITLRMSGLLNVALAQNIDLYGIVKGNFGVVVNGGGTCHVNASMPLSAAVTGCNGPYTYTWEGVTDSDADAMPSTSAPGTYNYTVIVTDKYGIQQTATAQVKVEEPPVAGTANGGQILCAGTTVPDITLTGYTGTIVRWERSANDSFTNPQSIASTHPLLTSQMTGHIDDTTYFRAVIKHNSYPEVYSAPAIMTVKKSTWNGTAWSNGVPDIETTIYFTGNYEAASDLSGCSLYVENNANVIIPSGFDVTLHGAITVNSGSFRLRTNANLLQQTNAENIGNIVVERNSSLLYRLDYTQWSSPVTGTQTLQEFSPVTTSNRFYVYNPVTDLYAPITPNIPFAPGKGYLIRMPNGDSTPGYNAGTTPIYYKGTFIGKPNNGSLAVPLSQEGQRYSAVGNPYPSPINLHAFMDANQDAIDPSAALYFWRKKNDSEQTSYATLTKMAYTSNKADGGDTSEGVFIGDPSQWVINAGQGFILQAKLNGVPLVFNNVMRRTVNNNQFFRTSGPQENGEISRVWLNLAGANESFSQMALGYSATGTLGIDFGWDGRALTDDGKVALYTMVENIPLAIQARPSFENTDVVPVIFRADEAGTYSIAIDHMDGVFAAGQDIFLRDNHSETIHDLKESTYEFTTEAGTFTDRFDVLYADEALGMNSPVLNADSVIVYKQASNINISSDVADITSVSVYDMRGRLLYSKEGINASETVISGLQAAKQVLIVNITTTKGDISKKIVF